MTENRKKIAQKIAQKLTSEKGAMGIICHGSVARGDTWEGSDLDLTVAHKGSYKLLLKELDGVLITLEFVPLKEFNQPEGELLDHLFGSEVLYDPLGKMKRAVSFANQNRFSCRNRLKRAALKLNESFRMLTMAKSTNDKRSVTYWSRRAAEKTIEALCEIKSVSEPGLSRHCFKIQTTLGEPYYSLYLTAQNLGGVTYEYAQSLLKQVETAESQIKRWLSRLKQLPSFWKCFLQIEREVKKFIGKSLDCGYLLDTVWFLRFFTDQIAKIAFEQAELNPREETEFVTKLLALDLPQGFAKLFLAVNDFAAASNTITTVESLYNIVNELRPKVIAFDGPCGAGKSWAIAQLQRAFPNSKSLCGFIPLTKTTHFLKKLQKIKGSKNTVFLDRSVITTLADYAFNKRDVSPDGAYKRISNVLAAIDLLIVLLPKFKVCRKRIDLKSEIRPDAWIRLFITTTKRTVNFLRGQTENNRLIVFEDNEEAVKFVELVAQKADTNLKTNPKRKLLLKPRHSP